MSDWVYFKLGRGVPLLDSDNFCFYDYVVEFVHDKGKLPTECCNCHKVLVFWDGFYSSDNSRKFKSMLSGFTYQVNGKYNDRLAVIYADSGDKRLRLCNDLVSSLNRCGVSGRVQWRLACREWQDEYPEMFSTAKVIVNPSFGDEYSIKTWLCRNGISADSYDSW